MVTAERLSIDRYLEACIQIEEIAAEIYRSWSQASSLDRVNRNRWRELEQEERLHIQLLEQLRHSAHVGEIGVRMLTDDQVLKMVEYARSCLVRIRISHYPSRVALFLAIRMKERCAHFYATQTLALLDKRVDRTFRKLSHDDKLQSRQLRKVYVDCCEAEVIPTVCSMLPAAYAAG